MFNILKYKKLLENKSEIFLALKRFVLIIARTLFYCTTILKVLKEFPVNGKCAELYNLFKRKNIKPK
jgi:hypothetical protein